MRPRHLFAILLALQSIQSAGAGTRSCVEENLRSNLEGALFLHGLYPALHKTPMVVRAENILAQLGEKNPKDVQRKIAAWLSIVEQTHSGRSNPEVLQRLKEFYYREHVVTAKDFPESYFALQKKIAREQGHGDVDMSPEMRAAHIQVQIADQKKSLDPWIEYLSSADANYPMWAKVWAFNGMTRIGKIDVDSGQIVSRTGKTVTPFIDLNREALSYSVEAVQKYLHAKQSGRKYIDVEPKADLRDLVEGGNFGKIYTYFLRSLSQSGVDLHVTDGVWVKYPKGSDPGPLVQSLQCKNTGWCTAGEATAQKHLGGGDFYVYYSHDASGQANHPRVAIRMTDDQIAEVRGIGPDQELDPVMATSGIVDQKLKEFGSEGERYRKRSSDMKQLTLIERKTEAEEDLAESELRFLYEIDSTIEGFGYKTDPRVFQIISKRDKAKDYGVMFHVEPEKISFTKEEALSGNKTLHYGVLELGSIDGTHVIKLPDVVYGNFNLSEAEHPEKLLLPKVVHGDFYSGMNSGANVIFPIEVHGRVYLNRMKTAPGARLPEVIHGELSMSSLTGAENVIFPKKIHGSLNLSGLKNPKGLRLPKEIDENLDLSHLESAKGLIFPEKVGGEIDLRRLMSSEGLEIPSRFKGKVVLPKGMEPRWID